MTSASRKWLQSQPAEVRASMHNVFFTDWRDAAGCHALIYPSAFNTITGPLNWELLQRARFVVGTLKLDWVTHIKQSC
jgi:predicted amidohydrolase